MASFKRGEIRDILTKAGVSEENLESTVTEIVKMHISVVDPLKSENEQLDSKAKQTEKLKSQLEDVKAKLTEYEEADYKGKYEAEKANGEKIKSEYEKYKAEQAGKAARAAKEKAFREILKDAGVREKHYDKVIKYSDIDSIELDDNGKAKNAKEILKSIQKDWDDHIDDVKVKGADTPTPPADNKAAKNYQPKADIMKIADSGERQAAIKAALEAGSTEFNA